MSTHPDGTTRDADLIREILARESETVSQYLHLAAKAEDPVTRDLILHLAKEEKEHIAECAKYLTLLDGEYRRYFERDLSTFLDHATGGHAPAAAPQKAQEAVADDVATEPTVGALQEDVASEAAPAPPEAPATPRALVGPVVGQLTVGGLVRHGQDD